jgi:hypothetical protein
VATTTTIPKVPQKYLAIGDSVMQGAVAQLQSAGFMVDAKKNRAGDGVRSVIDQLVQSGDLGAGTTVVIQVGTNALVTESQFATIMQAIPSSVAGVFFLTVRAPGATWIDTDNLRINALPTTFASRKVKVIDWATGSQTLALCADGTHVSCGTVASKAYTNLILTAVGLPAIP